MNSDFYEEIEIPQLKKSGKNFSNRGLHIEKFILSFCEIKSFKNVGVTKDICLRVLLEGYDARKKSRIPMTIRASNRESGLSGLTYLGSLESPGHIVLTIGQICPITNLIEMIIHEFIHSIGYDHGNDMNHLMRNVHLDIFGFDIFEISNYDESKKYGTYFIDDEIIKELNTNWYKKYIGKINDFKITQE